MDNRLGKHLTYYYNDQKLISTVNASS